MKKKEQKLNLTTTVLIILLVIAAIVIVWNVVDNSINEPHFRITKEECWNEINGLGASDCSLGCSYFWDYLNVTKGDYVNCRVWCLNTYNKEICEQVEVNAWVWSSDESTGIDSSKLTKEWLDENCECIKEGECKMINKNTCKIMCGEYKCRDYYVETWNQLK